MCPPGTKKSWPKVRADFYLRDLRRHTYLYNIVFSDLSQLILKHISFVGVRSNTTKTHTRLTNSSIRNAFFFIYTGVSFEAELTSQSCTRNENAHKTTFELKCLNIVFVRRFSKIQLLNCTIL